MLQTVQTFLKNTGCSYCQENDYSEDKNINKNWLLYLKEAEMYSSLVLYNKQNKKDISHYCNLNDKINWTDFFSMHSLAFVEYMKDGDHTLYIGILLVFISTILYIFNISGI